MASLRQCRQSAMRPLASTSALQLSGRRTAVTQLKMPAMSPTMTQGTLSKWQVKEGQPFAAGDVLLSIETDKAEIDVEAQDDGILGRIVKDNGTADVPVGEVIALLSEEGDTAADLDAALSSSEPDKPASSPKPQPTEDKSQTASSSSTSSTPAARASPAAEEHAPTALKGLLPSVFNLCVANQIDDPSKIKATGSKGLTKGDVLAYLGTVKSPLGSLSSEIAQGWTTLVDFVRAKEGKKVSGAATKDRTPPTPAEIRHAIITGLARGRTGRPTDDIFAAPVFEDVLRDYASPPLPPAAAIDSAAAHSSSAMAARSLPRGDSLRAVLEA